MNKVFKVIWSEARNAYVVVSEIAKNHGSKSCSTKKLLTMLIATGVMTCASMAPAMAAPNVDASATVNVGKKAAVNVAENAKVNVKKDAKVNVEESAELTVKNGAKVTFSKDAGIGFENGAKINLGSKAGVTLADGAKLSVAKGSNVSVDKNITMGNGAVSSPYVGQTGNVAIGEKALAWNGNGLQEALMDFGQGGAKVKSFWGVPYGAEIVDGTKLPGSIAIGKNTVARSGSTMIGEHSYNGKIGDTTITPDGNGIMKYNNDVYSTTIGANSFNSGALASVTGVFSIASSKYDGANYKFHAVQNTGATIYGSMNSIESATSDAEYSGIASSVLGFANRTQNANAALIWGTGNEVTNSIENIGIDYNGWNKLSVAEAQQKAIKAMQSSDYAGGSVMAIGGGNKADYAKYSQLTGVQNKVIGTKDKAAKYNFVNGYQNTVTNASDVTVIGIKNEVTADGNKVIGDNQKVSGKNNVIFGSADKVTETTVNNAVVLGHNAKVTGEGGVALGAGSVADRAAGEVGYDPATGKAYDIENGDAPDYVWQATSGAVSVGSGRDTRQITNVAAGTEDTDAVNVAQLKKVNEEALKHSTVTNGDNITVTEDTNKDGGKEYKVALNNDITLAGDTGDFVSISGSKGTIWASGSVTAGSVVAGSVVMDGATSTVSGLSNKTIAYEGFATTGKAATEEQLKEVATEAGKHTTVTDGANITVTEGLNEDGGKKYKVALNNDILLSGDNDAFVNISGSKGTIWTSGSVAAGNVVMDGATATVSGLGNTTTAYDGFANGKGKAATEEQLKEISKVADNANQGWNLSTNGDAASKVAPGETVDFSGDKNISVSNNGKDVKVELNKDIDVNSVQTNALNAKYNLSVGTANENGTVPFFVNSNGAFYAANGKLVVDKDGKLVAPEAELGKVTADEGVIGNVVLKDGVFYKNSALRDGELFIGDADGNYSQITPKSAKLGQVTIDEKGNIAGANHIQTNALNAKYNLSVGTANENGTVPFFVNSNGAFYAANGKLVVDKDGKLVAPEAELGKVTADEGVIGNVVLKDGVFYKNSALRDGELFIGDADGNYSQITTKGAKLGKVTVAADGKISGVAAGAITADSTDAVNGSQLHAVATEAGKHSKVVNGNNTNVEETTVDGQKVYKVNLNNNIMVGDITGKYVSISGTNGTIEATGAIATKDRVYADKGAKLADIDVTGDKISNGASSIVLDGSNVKVNDKVTIDQNGNIAGVNSIQTNALNAKYNLSVGTANENGTVPFFVNSNGAFYAANGKLVVDKDGKLVAPEAELGKVTADEGVIGNVVLKDGVFYKNSALRDGELFIGDADGNYSQITTKGAKLGKVTVAEDGKISGVAAGAVTADSTDAVNGSQLHAVATEAGKHSKVVNGSNINVEETDVDGQKIYKVNLNKDIMLGDLTGKNVSISGTNGTIETTGYIATKDRVYADKGAKLADIDVTGNKISNGASSIVLDGSNVKVNDKVTIDQNGNIAGVNSLQTNALNAKYNLSVGTANENGIMPFFVNSNGAFYGANNNFSVDKDGKVTATAGEIGNVVLQNGVYTGHSALRDGELFVGDASGNYSQITTKGAKLGKVTVAEDGKISGVAAGAVTADSTDAVNGSQLHAVATEAGKHSKVVNGSNINVEETDVDGQKIYKVNLNKDIMLGDLTGKNVSISGTNGTIETTGYIATKDRVYADKGAKLADIDVTGNKISNGASSIVLDGSNVKVNDKVTIDQNGKISGVAAGEISKTSTDAINGSQLNQTNENVAQNKADIAQNKADIAQNKADIAQNKADIAQNKADIATNKADIAQNKADIAQNKTDIKNLDNRVTNVEELAKKHTTVTAGDNITVAETTNADGGKEYKVALNKDISVDSVKAGDTTITDKGLEIKDGPSVTKDGINAGNKKITGVAKGEADTDAVNYGQLKETNNHIDRVENQVVSNTNRINQLGSRVNKVGAGAAALAALHPMDFDPDDKLTFSAGYGNYGGENAAAIGAYYRPDEKVMFSVGGTVGNGENMVNAGVSFSLDRTNHVSNSRTAMAREILDLRAEVTELKAMVAKGGLGSIAEDKMKIFPDVAENHWAYEYVGKLAAAGIIEGYPDGNFSGDRMMSRYEFAAMLYRAMQKGAQLDSKIINEFAPEMGRIRVDRISGEDGDRDKIERVRVNAVKGERDHYGNKIAKAEAKAK